MAKFLKIIIGVLVILILGVSVFMYMTSSVDKNNKENILVVVNKTDTFSTLGKTLYEKGLIKSELIYKIYVKLFLKNSHLEVGEYNLNKSMNLDNIIEIFKKGNNYNPDVIRITFREGINARVVAKEISNNTNNKYEDVNHNTT